jgi:hypothetical protein
VPGFELHHIGEPLLAAILTDLTTTHRLSDIPVRRLEDDVTCDTISVKFAVAISLGEAFGSTLGAQPKFAAECGLLHDNLRFDPLSQIDLLMIGPDGALPWEIKLGTTGLGRGDFLSKLCRGTGANKQHSNLVSGPMISILQDWAGNTGRLMGCDRLIATYGSAHEIRTPVERRWGLIARRSVVSSLAASSRIKTKTKANYGRLRAGMYVITFEDLVEAVTIERFWTLVHEILDVSLKRLEGELNDVRAK